MKFKRENTENTENGGPETVDLDSRTNAYPHFVHRSNNLSNLNNKTSGTSETAERHGVITTEPMTSGHVRIRQNTR